MTGTLRRRLVVAAAVVAGATLLGLSLATKPGDPAFVPLLVAVAAIWVGGALLSGPLHLGHNGGDHDAAPGSVRRPRRPIWTSVGVGLAAGAVFLAGGALLRLMPPLREPVVHVLDHAREGTPWLVGLLALVNAVAEELFFRGAVFEAVGPRHPIRRSTAVYVVVTAASGNPMLAFAGAVMGTLWGWQRRATNGVLAPLLSHVTWSVVVFAALPPVIGS